MSSHEQNQNRLGNEQSPYLQQHKDNPIWWFPWGDDAFTAAATENKPVFLSIGYSTCHWCHVMEGDSFEKEDVAELLNASFVSVKVDREERPDVDSIYMNVAQMLTGRGGWPLSIIMTPDRKPFWAGTFVDRLQFKSLLTRVSEMWNSDERQKLLESGEHITNELMRISRPAESIVNPDLMLLLQSFYKESVANFDSRHGGFSHAPKFPPAMTLMTLLRLYRRSKTKIAPIMVTKTLDEMARGGIHDQVGGGFHRYSTDEKWFAPHFEKMIYDNALICISYLEAWQYTQKREYLDIAEKTLDYFIRDMQEKNGGFCSAEDADSEKTEGKFYTWTIEELKETLENDEFEIVVQTFDATVDGNYKINSNIAAIEKQAGLKELDNANILAHKSTYDFDRQEPKLISALEKLFIKRTTRIRPGRDDKILSNWNGLVIAALAKGSIIAKKPTYLKAATVAAQLIEEKLCEKNGKLLHRLRNGDARYNGYLEDYSYLIYGYIELYQASFDAKWIERAIELQDIQDEIFWDDTGKAYYESDGIDQTLLHRPKEFLDNATPSGNSVSALNLARLAKFTQRDDFRLKSLQVIQTAIANFPLHTRYFPFLLLAVDFLQDEAKEIVFVGADKAAIELFLDQLQSQHFLPNQIMILRQQDDTLEGPKWAIWTEEKKSLNGAPTAYVCTFGCCQLPTTEPLEAWRQAEVHNTIDLES